MIKIAGSSLTIVANKLVDKLVERLFCNCSIIIIIINNVKFLELTIFLESLSILTKIVYKHNNSNHSEYHIDNS